MICKLLEDSLICVLKRDGRMESKVITFLTQWNIHPTMPWGHKTQHTFSSKKKNKILHLSQY